LGHLADPLADPQAILGRATTRLVYDLFAYQRSKHLPDLQPAVVYSLARATHDSALAPGAQTRVQHGFAYSDGFGREVQQKGQAEPTSVNGVTGPPRWVASGWTIFNNKGKPVRQYEPFFSASHGFEFGLQAGVSAILFYDPAERVVATLHPNHSYEKVVFDPWQQTTWDANDTVLGDPRTDADTQGTMAAYFETLAADPAALPWQTWHAQRQGGALGLEEQTAASKAAAHADTPTTAHADTLGRPFLTVAHNKVASANHDLDGTEDKFHTRVELDIEGNELAVRDALRESQDPQGNTVIDELGRVVMRYAYDMLGNRIHQASMEGGARWMLGDVTG
ncbi:MAG: toxin, partial [Delftia sp.]|nr:toxin [Delftia sp.]